MIGAGLPALLVALLLGAGPAAAVTSQTSSPTELNNLAVAEAQAGRFEAAAELLRQALALAPQDTQFGRNLSGILTDWAAQFVRRGRESDAQRLLEEAVEHDPANGTAWLGLGDLAYFSRSAFDEAIRHWTQAAGKVSPEQRQLIQRRVATARRDRVIEQGFVASTTKHFAIRVQGAASAQVDEWARTLEAAYERVASSLGEGPARLTVIIYTERDLRRAYNQRDWAAGFYDGRVRLRQDEFGSPLAQSLCAHELAHAFLFHRYGRALPIWVHEGLAQRLEEARPRTPREQEFEARVRTRTAWVPLKWLDQRFSRPSGRDDVERAYVESRIVIEELVRRFGMPRVQRFLEALASGRDVPEAFDAAFAPLRWARVDQGRFE
jgi:tetratricopeptide (TPR) repeat protein